MRNLACLFLCAFMVFNLSSCSKSDSVDNSEKVTPYRLHELLVTDAGVESTKNIYVYNSSNRLTKIQIQRKKDGVWKGDSEVSFVYTGSKITVTKLGAYVMEYTLSHGRVIEFKETESGDEEAEVTSFSYDSKGNLSSFTDDGTPFVISYDANYRFTDFTASFSALGETISMVGAATYTDDKITSLTLVKSISDDSFLQAKRDFVYFNNILLKESVFSYDEDTEMMETLPTVYDYKYDANNCLASYAISEAGVVDVEYTYSYEEGNGNAAFFEYLPDTLLLKKWTGGMIK